MISLWDRFRQDDAEATVLLYEQFYPALLSYGVQLCNNNEIAKDAISDVFLDLWDNRQKLKPVENVKAYLFACLRRKMFQSKSPHQVTGIAETDRFLNDTSDQSHEDMLVAMEQSEEIRNKVQKAMEKLTERQRELIRLKFFAGLTYQQMETHTGINMKTLYNTVYNGMKILADELQNIFLVLFIFILK